MLKKWISGWLEDSPQHQAIQPQLRLNLKKALVTLEEMRTRLEYELAGIINEFPMNAAKTENDRSCAYGQWLYSTGQTLYAETQEYKNAIEAHAFFHQIAADILYTHQSGNTKKAKQLLKTSFKEASNFNQIELVRLYNMTLKPEA